MLMQLRAQVIGGESLTKAVHRAPAVVGDCGSGRETDHCFSDVVPCPLEPTEGWGAAK